MEQMTEKFTSAMQQSLSESIHELSLSSGHHLNHEIKKNTDLKGNGFVDITAHFTTLQKKIEPGTVLKTPQFDLFSGTYALEINNPKLDSTLIEDDLPVFQSNIKLHDLYPKYTALEHVTNILDSLLKHVVTWIDNNNNNSLTITILSCKYVQDILDYYTETLELLPSFGTGDPVYDDLLRYGIFGVLYFIEFIKSKVDSNYIMEEEDIHTTLLNLDCISGIPNSLELISKLISYKKKYCGGKKEEKLEHVLNVIIGLCGLDEVLLKGCLEVEDLQYNVKLETFDDIVSSCEKLINIEEQENITTKTPYEFPKNLFSQTVQKQLSNFLPPKELIPHTENAYLKLVGIVKEIQIIFKSLLNEIDSVTELNKFVYYYMTKKDLIGENNSLLQLNVISRILYSHLLNENSKLNFSNIEFLIKDIETVVKLNEESKEMILDYKNNFLQYDVESLQETVFNYYYNFSSNNCRYRQCFNRQLLMWDSLQARFSMHEEQPPPPPPQSLESPHDVSFTDNFPEVTSFVYYRKLKNMFEFLVRGFQLEIYQSSWESFPIYWNCYDLLLNLEYLINKLIDHNNLLIEKYNKLNLSKNLKKKYKSAEKRKQIKSRNEEILNHLMIIEKNLTYESKLTKIYSILTLVQILQYVSIYNHLDISTNNDDDDDSNNITKKHQYFSRLKKFMNDEMLYKLRFKSFESFGVPQTPTLQNVLDSLKMFQIQQQQMGDSDTKLKNSMDSHINQCKVLIQDIIASEDLIDNDKTTPVEQSSQKTFQKYQHQWFKQLDNTCDLFLENYGKPGKVNTKDSSLYHIDLEYRDNTHSFFPIYNLS